MPMKRILCAALFMTLIVVSLPRLFPVQGAAGKQAEGGADKAAERLEPDSESSIRLLSGDTVSEMSVFDYLTGVVAAEMPVSFEPEALKAQSVAARSYLRRAINSPKHEGADICADSACCQAYLSREQLKSSWGYKYEAYIKKIKDAVAATDGEYLSYDGAPALAAFHSSSDGATEDASALWSEVPYLKSVSSPETGDSVPNFVSTVECSEIDFRDTILYLRPEADMTGDASAWIGKTEHSSSGRVASVSIGGVSFTGSELRQLFKLRSTDFELSCKDGKFIFTVHGYGHGIGMSQYGANVMAKDGADYREILVHYYPSTVLVAH